MKGGHNLLIPFYLLLLTLGCYKSIAQTQYAFETVDADQGFVQCILQDKMGFLWIGNGGRLNRYDGYEFRSFLQHGITNMIQDKSGSLYLVSNYGLEIFDPSTEKVISFQKQIDSLGISKFMRAIVEDNEGNFWIASQNDENGRGGLVLFNKKTHQFKKFNNGFMDYANTLAFDENGNLWIGANGITIFDTKKQVTIRHFFVPEKEVNQYTNTGRLLLEKSGVMWACTDHGLARVSFEKDYTSSIEIFHHDERNQNSLINDFTTSIIKDRRGNFWISTHVGISLYNQVKHQFTNFVASSENQDGLKESRVNVIFEDRAGNIWLGHYDLGLSKVKSNKGFIHLVGDAEQGPLDDSNVSALHLDRKGLLWVAIVDHGINQLDFGGNYYKFPDTKVIKSPHRRLLSICEGSDHSMWVAGQEFGGVFNIDTQGKILKESRQFGGAGNVLEDHRNRLWVIDEYMGVFKRKRDSHFDQLLPDSAMHAKLKKISFSHMLEDDSHRLWVSAWQGDIFCYDSLQDKFYKPAISNPFHINIGDDNVSTFRVSHDNYLWVATFSGLCKYKIDLDAEGRVALILEKLFSEREGLVAGGKSDVYSISLEEDYHGNLWLAQNFGLYKLNPRNNTIKRYAFEDGLSSKSFSPRASSQLQNGFIALGSKNGVNIFHPDSLKENQVAPAIAITDFKLLNRSVPVAGEASEKDTFTIKQTTPYMTSIEVPHHLNVIGFEFASLDFTATSKNEYAYQLVGFDHDWVYSGNRRSTTYTNLDAGEYTFKVKGSNNDGIWNEAGTSIKLVVLPPLWKTWWAYSGYGIAIVFLLLFARREILSRERMRNEIKLKDLERNRYQELDILKSRFFSNISHEFRTPLTLILGPLQKLLEGASGGVKSELSIMQRNALRLLNLVNQLLDLSRLEAGALKLKCVEGDINRFVNVVSSQFFSIASSKEITFTIHSVEGLVLYFDEDKLNKIISNLLSNAFKFTPMGGTIEILIRKGSASTQFPHGYAEISVIDSGPGIPEEHVGKIFDRFYQVDSSSIRTHEGAGIGLALTKELVELHQGTIIVLSSPMGSIFKVLLPMGNHHLSPAQMAGSYSEPEMLLIKGEELTIHEEPDGSSVKTNSGVLPTVLIVEDNADLRKFIAGSLKGQYQLLQSENGEMGIAEAQQAVPDLIISDLMMPKVNGLELCRQLKENEKTSHIPIILLTAKADVESRIQGFHTGADDYISKPFEMRELEARIRNLLDLRSKLQEKYTRQLVLKPTEIKVESLDERFLRKVMDVVEARIADASLDVDILADEVAMSGIQLYRKLKALTGTGPNDFIRNYRLQRAADLLSQKAGGVGDIAYQVGFNSLSYFSKCFREKFEKTPLEYMKDVK